MWSIAGRRPAMFHMKGGSLGVQGLGFRVEGLGVQGLGV